MKIVVLSGKGGTGKTTVSTNLSQVLKLTYVDCDVEEPNGHIFIKNQGLKQEDVFILNPEFNKSKCNSCGDCVEACQFNALAKVLDQVMLFSSLCHGCGACTLACKNQAITEKPRAIGKVLYEDHFYMGQLNIGEPMGGPVIQTLNEMVKEPAIFDAPPGTSCSVVSTLQDADYALLVTEPTQFGLHDLKLAVDLVQTLNIPFSILENRHVKNESMISDYCKAHDLDLIYQLPFSKKAARQYASGHLLIQDDAFKEHFEHIGQALSMRLKGADHGNCSN